MMNSNFRFAVMFSLALALLTLNVRNAYCTTIVLQSNWTALLQGSELDGLHFPGFAGAHFDTSRLSGSGVEAFEDELLEFLGLGTATIGSTTFDLSNSSISWIFIDGDFFSARIGGNLTGAGGISGSDEDFMLEISNPSFGSPLPIALELDLIRVSDTTTPFMAFDDNPGHFTTLSIVSVVPEPSTLTLLSLCSVALFVRRRRS